jgi:hypothetical protein
MTNWVITHCTVEGDDAEIERFKSLMVKARRDGSLFFDFEGVAPLPEGMPVEIPALTLAPIECLPPHGSSGVFLTPSMIAVIEILTGRGWDEWDLPVEEYRRLADSSLSDIKSSLSDIKIPAELQHHIEKEPEVLEGARRYFAWLESNLKLRRWTAENWGTIRHCYEFRAKEAQAQRYEFTFETAWTFPEPIFRKLSAEFPTLVFTCNYFEELGQFGGYCRAAGASFELRRDQSETPEQSDTTDSA